MNTIEAAAVERWQLQNETVAELPDEVCAKTIKELCDTGWESRFCKLSIDSQERTIFDSEHFAWALSVGKMAVGDEVAPWSYERQDGTVCYGIAVWRRALNGRDDSIETETVVE